MTINPGLLGLFGFLVLAVFLWWRVRHPRMVESLFTVEFDDTAISVTSPNAEKRSLAWSQLTKVGIRTTDEGPMQADVFLGLHRDSETPAVVFPGGATGESEIIAAMQARLPGFSNEELIKAMGSTSNAHFVIWEAASAAVAK